VLDFAAEASNDNGVVNDDKFWRFGWLHLGNR